MVKVVVVQVVVVVVVVVVYQTQYDSGSRKNGVYMCMCVGCVSKFLTESLFFL